MNRFFSLILITIVLFISFFMVIHPHETVNAAADGIKLWSLIVVPALLPFFIIAELLVSLRFVNVLGILLEPLMRPLFHLPGCSSLVIVMGFTSGFPIGAVLTRRLYEEQLLTADEAERLVSFTNNSSPLFIIGAIGIGMFSSATVGYILAISHYLANLGVGLLWRFRTIAPIIAPQNQRGLLSAALASLEPSGSERKSIGYILGDAIKNSLNNILAVGGFILLFSVLTRVLTVWGGMDILAALLQRLLSFFGVSYSLAYGLSTGLFEITLGAKTIAAATEVGLFAQIIGVSAILALSGLSIIAQIMSITAGMPVRFSFYLLSRLIQVILSCIISVVLFTYVFASSLATMASSSSLPLYKILYGFHAWQFSLICMLVGFICIAIMLFVSALLHD